MNKICRQFIPLIYRPLGKRILSKIQPILFTSTQAMAPASHLNRKSVILATVHHYWKCILWLYSDSKNMVGPTCILKYTRMTSIIILTRWPTIKPLHGKINELLFFGIYILCLCPSTPCVLPFSVDYPTIQLLSRSPYVRISLRPRSP